MNGQELKELMSNVSDIKTDVAVTREKVENHERVLGELQKDVKELREEVAEERGRRKGISVAAGAAGGVIISVTVAAIKMLFFD